jgi:hypothetical protein
VFELVSDQTLTGLTASDFGGTGYTVDSLTPAVGSGNKIFEVAITPTASGNISVRLPADAATGAVLGTPAITALPDPIQIIKAAAGGGEIVVNGLAERVILLGAGSDVIKVGAFTPPSSQGPAYLGVVAGAEVGDGFDLSGLFKGLGYSSALESDQPDPAGTFVTLENLLLQPDPVTQTTLVTFDVMFDSPTVSGSRINSIKLDLDYDPSSLVYLQEEEGYYFYWTSKEYQSRGKTLEVLDLVAANPQTGSIAATNQDQKVFNTQDITDANGKVLSIEMQLNKLVDSFRVGFDSGSGNSYTLLSGETPPAMTTGSAKTARAAGVPAGATANVLEFSGTTVQVESNDYDDLPNLASAPGDNQLKYLQIVETGSDWGMLKFQFDTNPAVGTTTLSPVVEVDLVSTDLAALFNSDYVKLI